MLISTRSFAPLLLLAMTAEEGDLFVDRVAPVLERSCIECHGALKQKAGLSLTTREEWLAGSRHGAIVTPGDSQASPLLELLVGDPPEMPARGTPLSDEEVNALRSWIDEGLPWKEGVVLGTPRPDEDFWSLKPLERPQVPSVDGIANPIDAFVRSDLLEKGLAASPRADSRTLARRLWLNLTGLHPSFDEVQTFAGSADPDSYEKTVDSLLGSTRYGERFARHWLDVAHYADTHGYDKDKPRPNAWPYRDWVIAAFANDMQWSEFARLQLAGDVLYPNDPEAVAATGFIVAGPWDFVGQVELREGTHDKQVTRNLDRDDMVTSTMTAFSSTTVHCARCHDHRFDPIPQADYYALQSVFAGVERADRLVDRDPTITTRRNELGLLEAALLRERKSLAGEESSPGNGWHSEIADRAETTKWVQIDLGKVHALERVVLVPARPVDFADTPGFGFPARFKVEASLTPDFDSSSLLAEHLLEDFPNPADAAVSISADGVRARHVRVTATELWERNEDWVFALAELQVFVDSKEIARGSTVTALDSIEAGLWGRTRLVDGYSSRKALGVPANEATRTKLEQLDGVIGHLREESSSLARPRTVFAVVPREPRPVHVLDRGEVGRPLDPALPGALSAVSALPSRFDSTTDEGARRLALADWLIDRENPLFWRSAANRIWGWHFGRPLVDTPNDFGRMGSSPSHPELLDWLACELRDGRTPGELGRLLITSETWKQSTDSNQENAVIDAGNKFLWRANRRRLSAEEIRDLSLQLSGELSLDTGGPGFKAFGFEDDESPRFLYARRDVNEPSTLRRSIYRFIVRSVPDPWMQTLDCADPSSSVPVRNETTTPLQALAMLNDRFLLERASRFAEHSGSVDAAFRATLLRAPSPAERAALEAHERQHGLESVTRVLFNLAELLYVD